MRLATLALGFLLGAIVFIGTSVVLAWTGPTSAPPNGNVSAPINVGATDQIKNAGLGINSLAVFGNAILSGTSRYLNFGSSAGSPGYGIRDNAGTMEFKNSAGSWGAFLSTSTSSGISAQIFTSSGTFTVPSGVTAVKVILIGGGGGVDADRGCVGGGGAGGTATKWLSGLASGANVPVVVGASGGTTDGGASSFGGVIAYGHEVILRAVADTIMVLSPQRLRHVNVRGQHCQSPQNARTRRGWPPAKQRTSS